MLNHQRQESRIEKMINYNHFRYPIPYFVHTIQKSFYFFFFLRICKFTWMKSIGKFRIGWHIQANHNHFSFFSFHWKSSDDELVCSEWCLWTFEWRHFNTKIITFVVKCAECKFYEWNKRRFYWINSVLNESRIMSVSLAPTIQYSIVLRDANQIETNLHLLMIANRHCVHFVGLMISYFLSSFLVHWIHAI